MKKWTAILTLLCCVLLLPLPLSATDREDYLDDTMDQLGEAIENEIPEEAEELLEQLDLSELGLQQILSLRPEQFLSLLKEQLQKQWEEPLVLLGKIAGIVLLSALLLPLKDSLLQGSSANLFPLAAVSCLSGILAEPVARCMEESVRALEHCSTFLLSLIPILGGLLTVGGKAATASGYQLLLFGACQLVSQLAVSHLLPLLGIYFALSLVSAVFPQLGMQGIIGGIKSFVCWSLGILTTLFVGLLSLQTFVTSSVDAVTLKASRFLMGSFIPVVGSILSEAFGAAQGCISLLKSTVGTFGILVALCTMLPILLQLCLWYFSTWAAMQISNMLQEKELSAILKAATNSFGILLALLLCFLLLIVVATTLVICIGTGG